MQVLIIDAQIRQDAFLQLVYHILLLLVKYNQDIYLTIHV
jgi:hypothetical protein